MMIQDSSEKTHHASAQTEDSQENETNEHARALSAENEAYDNSLDDPVTIDDTNTSSDVMINDYPQEDAVCNNVGGEQQPEDTEEQPEVTEEQGIEMFSNQTDEHCSHGHDTDIQLASTSVSETNHLDKDKTIFPTKPPAYTSLVESILRDEPPKYEVVTGKKLKEITISGLSQPQQVTAVRSTYKRKCMAIMIVAAVVIVVGLLSYLSITSRSQGDSSDTVLTTRRTNFVGRPK